MCSVCSVQVGDESPCVLCVQFKLGMSLMKLAFSLESWEACGGDADMSGEEAVQEAGQHVESALQIFKEVCLYFPLLFIT